MSQIKIVEDILTNEKILIDFFNLESLGDILNSPNSILKFFAERGLIKNEIRCECGEIMLLYKNVNKNEGYLWNCNNYVNNKRCKKTKSVRYGSIFNESKMDLKKIIIMIYMWTNEYSQTKIEKELGISHSNICTWTYFFREIIQNHIILKSEKIGGLNDKLEKKVVEIDESYFFKRKYNKGMIRAGEWIFGGIERGSGKCFLVHVQDRKEDTLLDMIERYIEKGSHIISDNWAGYNILRNHPDYTYSCVNHSENFVDPKNPLIHTNNVEAMWLHVKNQIRRKNGVYRHRLLSYIQEFMWRYKKPKNSIFNDFLILVKDYQ